MKLSENPEIRQMADSVMPIEEKYKISKIVLVFLKAGAIIRVEEVSKYGFSPFCREDRGRKCIL